MSFSMSTSNEEIISKSSKQFVINHPTKRDNYLVHACLEGPEDGVFYRGTSSIPDGCFSVIVKLPNYVVDLAYNFTVHITPICDNSDPRLLGATRVRDGQFTVKGEPGPFSWIVHGSRGEIDVEIPKSRNVRGYGPYRWVE